MSRQTSLKRLLVIAYYFPPVGGIGSIRLARFAKDLREFDWESIVLAPKQTPHQRDEALSFPESQVRRSRSIEPSRLRSALLSPVANEAEVQRTSAQRTLVGKALVPLRSAAHRVLLYPDPQIGWYPGAVKAGSRALREQQFDAIYSSSYPITAHLVARTLSRRASLPWVAEFRDAWSVSLPQRPHRRRAERLEQHIAQEATGVIMPTATWAAHFGQLWGREVAVVPNGYDRKLESAPRPSPPVITHLGTYYPGRQNLSVVWKEIARIRAEDPASAPTVRFVGELPSHGQAEVELAGIADLVEVTGFLPHEEAKTMVAASSVLLGVDVNGEGPAALGCVPAKLFEYLASDVPIVYLANPGSDAAAILGDMAGCYVVEKGHSKSARKALLDALSAGRIPRESSAFSRGAAARQLHAVLDGALHLPASSLAA
jgi:hypothetical protein